MYRVIISDGTDADADHIFDWLFRFNAPAAFRFRDTFVDAAASLGENPNGYPFADENILYERTVRRKLFKSGSTTYRLLFTVYEAGELGPDEPPTVLCLRVLHGAVRPLTQTEDNPRQ